MHGSRHAYESPAVTDYGDLERMTAAFHPTLGAGGLRELSFTSPDNGGRGGEVINGGGGGSGGNGGVDPSGTGGGGGGGGGGGAGGGKLPFTGLAAAVVAGVGAGLVGAGGALRRAVRRNAD